MTGYFGGGGDPTGAHLFPALHVDGLLAVQTLKAYLAKFDPLGAGETLL